MTLGVRRYWIGAAASSHSGDAPRLRGEQHCQGPSMTQRHWRPGITVVALAVAGTAASIACAAETMPLESRFSATAAPEEGGMGMAITRAQAFAKLKCDLAR